MPFIKLKNVSNYICRNVNLQVFDRELLVLFGPNGAGKTTLLNIIAGLVEYNGEVYFDSTCVDEIPASERGVGYVFQNLILFPHLNVASNIAFGLRARKEPPDRIKARINELLEMMKIKHLVSRYPKNLSGGEKQRVALARALASSPKILLLDEPLSSLDFQTAQNLRVELKQLQKKLGITTVYVCHNMKEAEEMADRIAVIKEGRIEEIGTEIKWGNKSETLLQNLVG
ncbi:MAG: transporter ATP-binding protein [Clostridiales bacterium]|jgi:ABC-type sugar transport system ATPase subunit|nr:transporter ATP-binding protein [Clostridiales bacterium]